MIGDCDIRSDLCDCLSTLKPKGKTVWPHLLNPYLSFSYNQIVNISKHLPFCETEYKIFNSSQI